MNKTALKDHLFDVIADRAEGMTGTQVAEKLGIKQSAASRLLSRSHETFSVDKLLTYCQAFGVTVEYKIGGRIYRPE